METKTKTSFFKDLSELQSVITNPPKTVSGYANRYQYAPLDSILDNYKKLCIDYNFILLAKIHDGMQVVTLLHESGENITGELAIPDFGTDAQKLGSFLTYARRYLIMNVLNIAGREDDDDGEQTKNYEPIKPKDSMYEIKLELAVKKLEQEAEGMSLDELKERLEHAKKLTKDYKELNDRVIKLFDLLPE